jgi:hypothetical protein
MRKIAAIAIGAALLSSAGTSSAWALSSKECSVKYQAAKQAGTLNGQKWSDFRKAECGPGATAATAPAPAAPSAVPASPAPSATAPVARRAPTAAPAGGAVAFPSAIDPKYASESAGKARMHTCLDAYNAAKAAGTLENTKWIQKGGGYYSACNARLKGV